MRFFVKRRIALGFGLIMVLSLGITAASFQTAARETDLDRLVTHTRQIQSQIEHVFALSAKGIAAERGYLLTGDVGFLQTRPAEQAEIEAAVAALRDLTANNPSEQAQIGRLRDRQAEIAQIVAQVIQLRKRGRIAAATRIVASGRAKTAMDDSQRIIMALEQQEGQTLQGRMAAVETYRRNVGSLILAMRVLTLSLVMVLYAGICASHKTTATTLESITDAFFSLDRYWNFTYVNQQAEILLQRKRQDLLGSNIWATFPDAEDAIFGEQYRRAVSENATQRFEAFYPPLNRWLEVAAYPSDKGLSVYFHDITSRKLLEERFRVLFEESSDAHLLFDDSGIVDCNNAAIQMLRCKDKADVLALHPATLSPELQPDGRRSLEKCMEMDGLARTNGYHRFEWMHRKADGTDFPVEVTLNPVLLNGKDTLLTVWHDLTERKQAEDQLRLLSTVAAESLNGIVITDPQERVVYANPAFERITGHALEELRGGRPGEKLQGAQTNPATREKLRAAVAARQPVSVEILNYHKSGQAYWVEMHIAPVFDAAGGLTNFVAIENDITERRQAEEALRRAQTRLEEAQRIAEIGNWEYNLATGAITWSQQLFHLVERDPARGEPDYATNLALYHPEDAARLDEAVHHAIADGTPYAFDLRRVSADGQETRWHHAVGKPVRDESGAITALVGTLQDITERKKDAERQEQLTALIANSADFIGLETLDGIALYINPAGVELLGLDSETQVVGSRLTPYYTEISRAIFQHEALPAILVNDSWQGELELRNQRTGATVCTHTHFFVVRHPHTRERMCIATVRRDITQQKWLDEQVQKSLTLIQDQNAELEMQKQELAQANSRLTALAVTDGLTGLYNHRAFQERLAEEYERTQRYKIPLSVILLDVDKFKTYNDAFGHPEGDTVLKAVAQELQAAARTTDYVCRYGGEEFVIILPNTDAQGAKEAAERFRTAIELREWTLRPITASFGVATLHADLTQTQELTAQADQALYSSKQRGRNRATHYQEIAVGEGLQALKGDTSRPYSDIANELLQMQQDTFASASEQVREALASAYDATILSWSRLLDMKDKETEGHSERVTEWMTRLARSIGMNEEEALYARWGALLHDVGKMSVPDAILHKPGPLTDEEWVVMRGHTTVAHAMLAPVAFLRPALDIPYCHHEKWDGTGYPRQLKGEEIPLCARLFAVVDVYDALTSDRPYRKAWSHAKTVAHLNSLAGSHFDPRAVAAFLTLLEAHSAENADDAKMEETPDEVATS